MRQAGRSERLIHVACGLCGADDPEPVAVGEDFEERRSDHTFLMVRCRACGLLYLNPRPAGRRAERGRIAEAHDPAATRRLLRSRRSLPANARVLAVCCGDGALANTALEASSYDLALALRTLEQSGDPGALLARIRHVLRPGGLLIVETGNANSLASRIFRNRYWGEYRFPRVWNLFTLATLSQLATSSGFDVVASATRPSPAGWSDSIRNALLDARAPDWLVERLSPNALTPRALFSALDALAHCAGADSLLRVTLQRPPL